MTGLRRHLRAGLAAGLTGTAAVLSAAAGVAETVAQELRLTLSDSPEESGSDTAAADRAWAPSDAVPPRGAGIPPATDFDEFGATAAGVSDVEDAGAYGILDPDPVPGVDTLDELGGPDDAAAPGVSGPPASDVLSPEGPTPGAVAPDALAPDAFAPDAPYADAPYADAPYADAPGSGAPAPDLAMPEASMPDVTEPLADETAPDTLGPEDVPPGQVPGGVLADDMAVNGSVVNGSVAGGIEEVSPGGEAIEDVDAPAPWVDDVAASVAGGTVAQAMVRLPELTAPQLRAVERYERAHQSRVTLLRAIDAELIARE